MQRQLSVSHLLINAKTKPGEVDRWVDKLLAKRDPTPWRPIGMPDSVKWREFDTHNEPLIREFDFRGLGDDIPFLVTHEVLDFQEKPTIAVEFTFTVAYDQRNTRKLRRVKYTTLYDPAAGRYLDYEGHKLRTPDKAAFDLFTNRILKRAMES